MNNNETYRRDFLPRAERLLFILKNKSLNRVVILTAYWHLFEKEVQLHTDNHLTISRQASVPIFLDTLAYRELIMYVFI